MRISISSHMLLTLRQVVIANNRKFEVGARDHEGGPNDGVNPSVERVIEEFVDLRS